ncbi:MAG TPA: hypothetical protein VET66_13555, partial [Steroidobacteraceae bacterium]|nr:hypothetical protein [Steroidobacteraceae bacterium]
VDRRCELEELNMHGRIHYRASIIRAGAATHAAACLRRGGGRTGDAVAFCAEREERSYRHYVEEHFGGYRTFSQLSPLEQRAYWSWRLTHLDQL